MMFAPAHVREISFDEDYSRILNLWQGIETGMNVGRSDTPEEIKKKLQRDPDLFLVAEHDGEIIGSVIGAFDGRRGMIYHLAVHRDFRGQGVGAALLTEVEQRLQAKGCLKCLLHVFADNSEAIQFYRERGWREQKEDIVFSKEFFV
ncbi:MAG: GNAT family N-acetyltransferase [Anaerolineales bacterium]|jgi:ribosomal protein S18 acetylase RimI-like enzyme|nr:GNAT family N-acetyltransferase [Anaerolineales bacterium]